MREAALGVGVEEEDDEAKVVKPVDDVRSGKSLVPSYENPSTAVGKEE